MQKNKLELNKITEEDNNICFYIHKENYDSSNLEFLNRKKGWNYEDFKLYKLNNSEEENLYKKVIIDCRETSDKFREWFLRSIEELDKKVLSDENMTYNQMFKELFAIFSNNKKSTDIETLHGDIGEALFILKCIELGYSAEIKEALRFEDNAATDFSFKKNNGETQHIEIKTTSFENRKIKLSNKQNSKENTEIIVIFCNYYEKETNILYLYEKISEKINIEQTILEEKRYKYESLKREFIESQTIKLDEIKMYMFNKEFLPIVSIENDSAVIKVIIELNTNEAYLFNETSLEQTLNEIFRN